MAKFHILKIRTLAINRLEQAKAGNISNYSKSNFGSLPTLRPISYLHCMYILRSIDHIFFTSKYKTLVYCQYRKRNVTFRQRETIGRLSSTSTFNADTTHSRIVPIPNIVLIMRTSSNFGFTHGFRLSTPIFGSHDVS